MALSTRQLARLGELLDHALPLSPDDRRAWLAGLPAEDLPLVQPLREALLAEDPDVQALRSLDRLPAISAAHDGPIDAEHRAGERLGAYELERPLGAGGMAEVWLARRADGAFDRRVALKIPRLGRVPTEMAERFARECRILATLEYPGIARLYDAGVDANGVPYIAMEYVQGEPLIAWAEARRLDAQARLGLFLQILDAVGHAHALGIVHRDLKPSNILVNDQGQVRLLDFGVAGLLEARTDARSLTQIYGRALTPEYASPELLRGAPVDARGDIYSLGAVLYELLTGARPAVESSDWQRAGKVGDIVAKALATAPSDRYQNVAAFAQALRDRDAAGRPGRRMGGKKMRYLLAALCIVAAGAGATLAYRQFAADDPAPKATMPVAVEQTTIAVLPFTDLSEHRDHGYLSDGLAEELIDLLAKTPELRVTARASSFTIRDTGADLPAIARRLGVANVLTGSVRASGSRVRISVQLARSSDGAALWSETYDRELRDIFEIQETVAAEVVEALKLRLLPANSLAIERRTTNVPAYEEYLLGRQYRDGISVERQQHAQAAFMRAAELDPSFAPAHAGIALTAAQLGNMTMTTAPYDLALAEAERAMALAPRLTEAYVARAHVRMHRNWDFIGARADLEFASSIEPNNMELLQAYGTFLWMTGRVAEALEIQRRNVARNPLSSTAWDWLGVMHLDARDYPEARKALERGAELSPYSDYRALLRTLVELYSGRREEAARLATRNSDRYLGEFGRALVAFETGHPEEGRAAMQRLIGIAPDQAAAQIAVIHAAQGNGDETFAWLERAIANRDPGLFSVQYHPELDRFKADPRWARVLRLMNLAP